MKKIISILLAAALLLTLTACAKLIEEPEPEEIEYTYVPRTKRNGFQVALLVTGDLEDEESVFRYAEAGLRQVEEEKRIDLEVIELGDAGKNKENWLQTLDETAKSKDYDIIICGTREITDVLCEAAYHNPQQKFVVIDDGSHAGEYFNVLNLTYKVNELGYLAGVLAASAAREKMPSYSEEGCMIGFLSGESSDEADEYLIGYIEGALSVDRFARVDVRSMEGKGNQMLSKLFAEKMIADNACSVIWNAAGTAGIGAAEAAAENGEVWYIGSGRDQELTLPEELAARTLTSGYKNITGSMVWLFNELDADREYWGQEVELGLAQSGVVLVTDKNYQTLVSDKTRDAVDEARKMIIKGDVVVHSHNSAGVSFIGLVDSVRP